jgi:DNA-directed RNA polymerase sigma subunit (sigma70/sigma32)
MPRPSRPDQVDRYVAMTLREIAAVIGVTPQRVMQIERKALQKIRKEMLRQRIVTVEGWYINHG